MKNLDANLPCPSCRGPLSPRVLACPACELRVEGAFSLNEFASLEPTLLHFLRIFVHCEGRIKDMEKALGVSYPTVKATMGQLKKALHMPSASGDAAGADGAEAAPPAAMPAPDAPGESPAPSALAILDAVSRGELDYTEALAKLKDDAGPRKKGRRT